MSEAATVIEIATSMYAYEDGWTGCGNSSCDNSSRGSMHRENIQNSNQHIYLRQKTRKYSIVN